ncbi:MAG TPA: sugar ABC transporter permease [Spirochaetia bacterium]|nr:sugar ABC transporter permease [Spirochaetia bacterium]
MHHGAAWTSEKRKRSVQKRRETRFVVVWLTPIMVVFALFSILPVFWGIGLSFFNYSALSVHNPFTGLANYQRILRDPLVLKAIGNTFQFVLIAVPANLLSTLVIAMGVNAVRSRVLKNTLRTLFFLPTIAPVAGAALIWSTMYNLNGGLFNEILGFLSIGPIKWLGNPNIAMLSVILTTLWADVGYNIVIFMAGLDAIPDVFYEAARMDGARRWYLLRRVTLPLLSRTTLFVTVMTVISYFQMFTQVQVMTNGDPQNATRVLTLHIYTAAFQYMDMGYASTMATTLLVITFVISLVQLRIGRSRWEY